MGVRYDSLFLPRRFFEDYKKNEKKEVVVDDILGADAARKAISEAMVGPPHSVPSLMQP